MSDWNDIMKAAARAAKFSPALERFYFLRHGQTDYNLNDTVQGWADIPLNVTGEQQANLAGSIFKGLGITGIYSSSLGRARRTAEIVSQHIGAPVIGHDDRLWEKSFGEYEHGPGKSINGTVWSLQDRGSESYQDFAIRSVAGLTAGLDLGGVPLVVAHGGTRRILLWALDLENTHELMANAVPLEFLRVGTGWHVNILSSPIAVVNDSNA